MSLHAKAQRGKLLSPAERVEHNGSEEVVATSEGVAILMMECVAVLLSDDSTARVSLFPSLSPSGRLQCCVVVVSGRWDVLRVWSVWSVWSVLVCGACGAVCTAYCAVLLSAACETGPIGRHNVWSATVQCTNVTPFHTATPHTRPLCIHRCLPQSDVTRDRPQQRLVATAG